MKTIPGTLIVVGLGLLLWAWFGYRRDGVSVSAIGLFWKTLTPSGTRLYAAGLVLAILGILFLFLGT
jgi:hypothetical protein